MHLIFGQSQEVSRRIQRVKIVTSCLRLLKAQKRAISEFLGRRNENFAIISIVETKMKNLI